MPYVHPQEIENGATVSDGAVKGRTGCAGLAQAPPPLVVAGVWQKVARTVAAR